MKLALVLLLLALVAWTAYTAPSKERKSESDGDLSENLEYDHVVQQSSKFGGILARILTGALLVSSSLNGAMAKNQTDFGLIYPGYSPAVGHRRLMTAQDQVPAPNVPKQFNQSAEKDDFKPTAPGHSPGVGHRRLMTAQDQVPAPNVPKQFDQSAEKDDFKPTVPGHSPGVGH